MYDYLLFIDVFLSSNSIQNLYFYEMNSLSRYSWSHMYKNAVMSKYSCRSIKLNHTSLIMMSTQWNEWLDNLMISVGLKEPVPPPTMIERIEQILEENIISIQIVVIALVVLWLTTVIFRFLNRGPQQLYNLILCRLFD